MCTLERKGNIFILTLKGLEEHRFNLDSLLTEFLSLPLPTIVAVTGHAAAAGFIFALAHDYIIMRRDRGFLYFSELDIGMVILEGPMSLIRAKIGVPKDRRLAVLRGGKITASMAVEMGIVDSARDGAKETLEAAMKLGTELVERKWDRHVYTENRKMLLGNVWDWKHVGLVDGEKKVASQL